MFGHVNSVHTVTITDTEAPFPGYAQQGILQWTTGVLAEPNQAIPEKHMRRHRGTEDALQPYVEVLRESGLYVRVLDNRGGAGRD